MLNAIWLGMMVISVITGICTGRLDAVVEAVTSSAKISVEIALGLIGVMAFWLGIMQIVNDSGLAVHIRRALKPVMRFLFPHIPEDHPAMSAMIMNMSANMLGLANAATPLGLKAMEELQKLNTSAFEASHEMCMFLAINTSSIQLIPVTSIAILAANGAIHPGAIVVTALIATSISTIVAVIAAKTCARR